MKEHIVSNNMKTDWSINFPIRGTCRPTKLCHKICYARKGRLAMDMSLSRQGRVMKIFQEENPYEIASVIAEGYRKRGLSFMRWCGSGDLTPRVVKVLDILGFCHPDTIHWIVTRKPEMAARLKPYPNFYIMFSLDGTEDSKKRKEQVDKLLNSRIYYSYLRQNADEDTLGASIIFNMQQKKGELPYDDKKRVCPVDAAVLPVEGACKKCRKCFSPGVYDGRANT